MKREEAQLYDRRRADISRKAAAAFSIGAEGEGNIHLNDFVIKVGFFYEKHPSFVSEKEASFLNSVAQTRESGDNVLLVDLLLHVLPAMIFYTETTKEGVIQRYYKWRDLFEY